MNVSSAIVIAAVCAASANTQVVLVNAPGSRPVARLNFDDPPVPVGPVPSANPDFQSVGISSVSLIGSWHRGGALSTGFSGNALVSNGNTLWVQEPFGLMDGPRAGAGMRFTFARDVASFGFVFVDETSHTVNIERFSGGQSIGSQNFRIDPSVGGGIPNTPTGWLNPRGRLFDEIHITNPQIGAGWGVDDIWVEIPAPGALAELGLGGLPALVRRR